MNQNSSGNKRPGNPLQEEGIDPTLRYAAIGLGVFCCLAVGLVVAILVNDNAQLKAKAKAGQEVFASPEVIHESDTPSQELEQESEIVSLVATEEEQAQMRLDAAAEKSKRIEEQVNKLSELHDELLHVLRINYPSRHQNFPDVRKITTSLDGSVWATSSTEEKATFTLLIAPACYPNASREYSAVAATVLLEYLELTYQIGEAAGPVKVTRVISDGIKDMDKLVAERAKELIEHDAQKEGRVLAYKELKREAFTDLHEVHYRLTNKSRFEQIKVLLQVEWLDRSNVYMDSIDRVIEIAAGESIVEKFIFKSAGGPNKAKFSIIKNYGDQRFVLEEVKP